MAKDLVRIIEIYPIYMKTESIKVLILPSYFHPERISSSALGIDRYQAFADSGFDMVVFTPTPTRGISKDIRQKYKKIRREILYDGHMIVFRFPLFAEGKNPIMRAFRYSLSCIFQFSKGVFSKYARECNVMFISSTPPIQGAMASLIKKITGRRLVYNLQDIFPDSLVGSNLTKQGSFLWKVGRKIEDFTYKNSDKIIVISDDFKKNILAKGVPEDKISVIYNWVNDNAIIPIQKKDNILYDELGICQDRFTIVYAGNFGHAQNIDVIISAARMLKEYNDIQFLMFGTGGFVDYYKELAENLDLQNMHFYPLQPIERVSYVYSLGNLGIVTCKKGLGKSAFPSKTWSIMATGTAVLANYDEGTDLENLIVNEELGVFSYADDVNMMVEQIQSMYNNQDLCYQYGLNARRYIENKVSKDISTQKYVDIIKEVINF